MKIARLLGVGCTSLVLLACNGQEVKTGTPAKVETEEEKVLYALGLVIAQNTMEPFKGQFSDAEIAVVLKKPSENPFRAALQAWHVALASSLFHRARRPRSWIF